MKFYSDLHIHSRYSRATSKELNPETLARWAQLKGIQVLGTGDFTHPGWLRELREALVPAEAPGFYRLADERAAAVAERVPPSCRGPVRFVLSAEISNIYKRCDRVRKVHNLVCVPDFAAAERIQARLEAIGNIHSDGRPILGLDSRDLLEITLESNPRSFLIPAHIWTPWFSALGSKSGFDSIDECYADLAGHIFAVETGLSSDPPMNWRLSSLDRFILVSHSDAHSPSKLGREATVFDTEFSYDGMYRALSRSDDAGLVETVEFYPEEGKYHYDGHRKCGRRMHPGETVEREGACPVCGKKATVGVMARVLELADRGEGEKPPRARPFASLIPLVEVVGESLHVGPSSRKAQQSFDNLLNRFGPEMTVLREVPIDDIRSAGGPLLAEAVRRVRSGEVSIEAGYDGEFGTVQIFTEQERGDVAGQLSLFEGWGDAVTDRSLRGTLREDLELYRQEETEAASLAKFPQLNIQFNSEHPDDVNDAQWEAITHDSGHLIIAAGPGTGKTHTLTRRIARIVPSLAPGARALAITFTNKAAEEMRQRLVSLGIVAEEKTFVGTFHSFCLQLLRTHGHRIGLPSSARVVGPRDTLRCARQAWPDKGKRDRAALLETVARWKASAPPTEPVPEQLAAYTAALRERQLLDFEDLLREGLKLLHGCDEIRRHVQDVYRYVFVDEYQDINQVQHELLRCLVGRGVRITAIGDPNQAIYGFRGANHRFFSAFADSFEGATTLYLHENYRTAKAILTASGQLLENPGSHGVPPLIARLYAQGALISHEAGSDRAEAEYVVQTIEQLVGGTSHFSHNSGRVAKEESGEYSFGDIAVLYRLNALKAPLEEALDRSGIPYQASADLPLAQNPNVGDALMLLRLACGESVEVGALRSFLAKKTSDELAECVENVWLERSGERIGIDALLSTGGSYPEIPEADQSRVADVVKAVERLRRVIRKQGICNAIDALHRTGLIAGIPTGKKDAEPWQRFARIVRTAGSMAHLLDRVMLQRAGDCIETRVEKVSLMTLHASKGLEFPVVLIAGCEEGIVPLCLEGMTAQREEERRLLYVGMTRARKRLYITHARRRLIFGQSRQLPASSFLDDIDEELRPYDARAGEGERTAEDRTRQLDLFS